uniref:Uncharacterized protein n=1 Tax=Arundo donax TaxID=35708 RepID=A0A0A9A3U4_ARUDO
MFGVFLRVIKPTALIERSKLNNSLAHKVLLRFFFL